VYADEAFENKKQEFPFPLHRRCFNKDETVTTSTWVTKDLVGDRKVLDETDDRALVETPDSPRYREVEAPK